LLTRGLMKYFLLFITCLNVVYPVVKAKEPTNSIGTFATQLNKVKNDTEDLSVALITLFVLKHQTPTLFKTNKFELQLKKIVSKLPKKMELASLFDVQSAVDYWYITKLLGHKDTYKVTQKDLSDFLDSTILKKVTDPGAALLYWIIIKSLEYCDSTEHKEMLKFIPLLEKKCEENKYVHAYLLTHIILYECQFGKTSPKKACQEAIQKLEKKIKGLKFEPKNIDILSEIVWCAKLCGKAKKTPFKKLEKKLNSLTSFSYFHERCMVLLATTPFE